MLRPKLIPSRLASLALACVVAGALPAVAQQPPKGVVYVQGNVAASPGNQIIGFKRDDAGKLTELPGSPYSAGGSGIAPSFNLGPYDSDSEIITNPSNTVLYATNGGSNSIAAFGFGDGGRLIALKGSPFSSGGSKPERV